MRAYVLCGGLGTRLQTVIQGGQKAVVEVQGEPFLLLVLRELRAAGIREAVLCAGHRADQLQALLDRLSSRSDLLLHLRGLNDLLLLCDGSERDSCSSRLGAALRTDQLLGEPRPL